MIVFDDVDDKFYAFEQLYSDILDEHATVKQTYIRGNQVPYMTEDWRKAIRHSNKLWKIFMRDRTDCNYELYKRQRNKCTSLRRKAIKEPFKKKSESGRENPREFWHTFRPFLNSKTKRASDIKENEVSITNKKQIADMINNHFLKLAENADDVTEGDFGEDVT